MGESLSVLLNLITYMSNKLGSAGQYDTTEAAQPATGTRQLGKATLVHSLEVPVTTRGVLYIHSAPRALCPHVEWAVAGVLGVRISLDWIRQPAAPGHWRAELSWQGSPASPRGWHPPCAAGS